MPYAIKTIVEPTSEPITLEEAKSHIRYPLDDQDANIARIYIPAARRRVEAECGRALLTQTRTLSLDDFPRGRCPIYLPTPPVQSVTSVEYTASDGTLDTVFPSTDYTVDLISEPARVYPKHGVTWPAVRRYDAPSTVLVTYVAGYANAASVPAGLREAMLLLIGHYFYHRESVVVGTISKEIEHAVADLIAASSVGDEFINYGA